MAAQRSPSRTNRPKGQARQSPPKKGRARRLGPALLWVGRVSRPRTATDLLTLFFVALALVTACALLAADIRKMLAPGPELWWCAVLLALATGARTSGWWRHQLSELTRERLRLFTGSTLLVLSVLSLSWHLLAASLDLPGGFLLPEPLNTAPWAVLILGSAIVAALCLILGVPMGSWLARGLGAARAAGQRMGAPRTLDSADIAHLPLYVAEDVEEQPAEEAEYHGDSSTPQAVGASSSPDAVHPEALPAGGETVSLPPIDLLAQAPKGPTARVDPERVSRRIEETLASFNVAARVVGHHVGPVVTQFDVQPERGVKVKSITALQNDLALALAAPTIRIQAPVPGKPVVGIEIPNSSATLVTLRELLESDQYRSSVSPLRVPLGKDVAGGATIIDLARMPHLLIAGATGSGKSGCVNAIISSLLYQNSAEQVRLLMIDPKMVELAVYNGVPHLLSPVVTQMDRVVGVMQWALREMERRYQLFAETTARNITRFNEKAESLGLRRLPYIVLVIDELADLMIVSPEEVEDAICRLAQLARAAGIHLVIATQRPSVDVVTGLIKANFPARIAFAMTSQVDSRTILDTAGAEKLLGRGDMLYQPPDAPRPVRLQGAWVSDQEVERLVDFWKRSPLQTAIQRIAEEEFATLARAAAEEDDELLSEAVRVVREYQHASVSLLQRRLKMGYSRAARVMDQLEQHGVVGPADGSRQRPVLDARERGEGL